MAKKALGKGLSSIFKELGSPVVNLKDGELLHEINLKDILPNPFQPRREFKKEELKELSQSISQKGLLQPILLRKHNNQYQIISGERRFRATQLAGKKTITSQIRQNVSDQDMMELSIIENIQRVQLSPIEEAKAYNQLIENFGLSHENISGKIGKSRSAITNTLRLLKLDKQIQNYINLGKLTAGHARTLLQYSPKQQILIGEKIINEQLNVRKSEQLNIKKKGKTSLPDPNVTAVLEKLKFTLGCKVNLKGTPKKGSLEICYQNQEELQHLIDILLAKN